MLPRFRVRFLPRSFLHLHSLLCILYSVIMSPRFQVWLTRLARNWRESVTWSKKAGIWAPEQLKMADLVSLEFDGKTLGLTPSNLSKTTIARFFNVHEEGLHLKVVHNGKTDNIWPLSNGKFLVPLGTTNAHVIAFNASEDSEDFVQGAFDFRLVLRVLLVF